MDDSRPMRSGSTLDCAGAARRDPGQPPAQPAVSGATPPVTAMTLGTRSAGAGSGGKAACGSVWYQYAVEKKLSERSLAAPCSMVTRTDLSNASGPSRNQRYI